MRRVLTCPEQVWNGAEPNGLSPVSALVVRRLSDGPSIAEPETAEKVE